MPKKAYASFAFQGPDGMAVVVSEDDIFDDDHPYVAAYPANFRDLMDAVTVHAAPKNTAVEQATAAPGEVRRGPGRPRNSDR